MSAIITLTTDSGLTDTYVAAMKEGNAAALLNAKIGSEVRIITRR